MPLSFLEESCATQACAIVSNEGLITATDGLDKLIVYFKVGIESSINILYEDSASFDCRGRLHGVPLFLYLTPVMKCRPVDRIIEIAIEHGTT